MTKKPKTNRKTKKPTTTAKLTRKVSTKPPAADSKAGKVLAAMRRPKGATAEELMKLTDWQAHTVRGFISGTARKALGLTVDSNRVGGTTTYRIVESK